ncbi:MAG: hypothetical protein B6244_12235 [Candidatus Cloacimonetes bacterium 4572_55]|nr:MAG: hypothetical protein B6244_12235 [Candidatus Cloacimonetes bacterium 4572_55]
MKKLSIGRQYLSTIIDDDCIYVDKTEYIHQLIHLEKAVFISRPRRFGKSLLISTLEEIFSGHRELFKGLWIYDRIEWETFPVIRIDFSKIVDRDRPLRESINKVLDDIAEENNIQLESSMNKGKFDELIRALSRNKEVVILIDEYDKPIIDFIDNLDQADENREILKNFYSGLKYMSRHIRFLFITGVSRFSRVSIFSDLNHLRDLTIAKQYSKMLGYTEDEIKTYFPEYLDMLSHETELDGDQLFEKIRYKYNGYSWDGKNFVYNPFSILNAFADLDFGNYWFATGTPTLLVKAIKDKPININMLEGLKVQYSFFDKFTLHNFDIFSLLFQTGYLTIKAYDRELETYTLSYPNNEVRVALREIENVNLGGVTCDGI